MLVHTVRSKLDYCCRSFWQFSKNHCDTKAICESFRDSYLLAILPPTQTVDNNGCIEDRGPYLKVNLLKQCWIWIMKLPLLLGTLKKNMLL